MRSGGAADRLRPVSSVDDELAEELNALERAGLRRRLRRWTGAHGPWIELDGVRLASFSSNNYLGLAGHEHLTRAAAATLTTDGLGAGASRLIAGNHETHEHLERALADFHRVEAALVFNSGFQANLGVIPALVGPGDLVLSDRLNHASLIDGCRLSRARVLIYDHADPAHVARLLDQHRPAARRALLVTESVFSMDGDRAPLTELAALAVRNRTWLMIDEAHAVGALGPVGRGIAAEQDVRPDVLVGTLGKAFGTFGAYVAGSQILRDFLLQRARSFVFSTALPPAITAASQAAVALVTSPEGDRRRTRLHARITELSEALDRLDLLAPGAGTTPIFPIHIGPEPAALEAARHLHDAGIHLQPIRPPTVPRGTSRLRLALMADHSTDQLAHLLDQLTVLRRASLIPPLPKTP